MPLPASAMRRTSPAISWSRLPRATRVIFVVAGLLVGLYLLYLISPHRNSGSQVISGWLVDGFEIAMSGVCLARAARGNAPRAIPLAMGASLLSWSLGDTVLTAVYGGSTPTSPSLADVFFIGFYPLMYLALLLLMRRELPRLTVSATWLDGAIAGSGAAALCAALAFHALAPTAGGSPLLVATHLAYPVGDLLLFGLVAFGMAVLPRRRRSPWLLIAAGCAINLAGDTFNVFQGWPGTSLVGTVANDVAWPASIVLVSLAVWLYPVRTGLPLPQRCPGFVLPGLGAVSGLAILCVGAFHHIGPVAVALATVTLAVVGLRLATSLRSLRTMTEEQHRHALTDDLTGLGNRRQLIGVLEQFFADVAHDTRPGAALAFLYVDLNRFKEINDSFGHAAGDELLRQLGPRLAGPLRHGDLLIRLGGDEFAVVLPGADAEAAATVAAHITDNLMDPFDLGLVAAQISASIGIALAPADAGGGVALLRCADLAMYRAKAKGRPFEIYDCAFDDAVDRARLAEELRAAIASEELVLYYQPQLDLATAQVTAVEALVRWPHPRLGSLSPASFLPLAEEAGLMRPLTEWVLDTALAQSAKWRAEGWDRVVAVNESSTNLLDAQFAGVVDDRLHHHGVPASSVVLEITETTIFREFERSKTVIAHLHSLGLVLSIDDFGAGFTSLAYLRSLPVGELKLDSTLVSGLSDPHGDRDRVLAKATVELGHALGLRLVAEGVEDAATLAILAEFGCDVAQGYFISRPLPPDVLSHQWAKALLLASLR